jgi:hypothetical protein
LCGRRKDPEFPESDRLKQKWARMKNLFSCRRGRERPINSDKGNRIRLYAIFRLPFNACF